MKKLKTYYQKALQFSPSRLTKNKRIKEKPQSDTFQQVVQQPPICSLCLNGESKTSIIERKQFYLLWIISILGLGLLFAYANEMRMRIKYEQIILGCVNEKPFLFNADIQIGIMCFRDNPH